MPRSQSRGREAERRGLFDPELEAAGRESDATRGGSGAGPVWSLGVAQPIEFASRRALRKAIANHQIALAEVALQDFERGLANRVRLLGYQTIVARKKSGAAEQVAERFRDLIRVLKERGPAGVGPLLEVRIIEANLLALERRRIEAERELQRHPTN